MLSRVANAIYWMSRYVERAENVARFVDVNLNLALDFPEAAPQWAPLVATTGDTELFEERYGEASRENVLRFLTFDLEAPNSIVTSLSRARENARSVREAISSEMWEQVNRAYLLVMDAARRSTSLADGHDLFTAVKQASQLFVGVTDLTMSHNEGWHFTRLARLLERADKTSRILDVKYYLLLPRATDVGLAIDEVQWAAVLRSASAFEMYRKRHGAITPAKIVQFLLLSQRFPRSVRFCLVKGEQSLHAITGTPVGTWTNVSEREMGRVVADLSYAETATILAEGLHEHIDDLQIRMNRISDAVHAQFFAMKPTEAFADDPRASLAPNPASSARLVSPLRSDA
ncbi:MAG: alpha-E domain-containing protein [Labilithrix sp.]|nr:alpha-E domain-containing protein [Labilithrix sp.]